MLWRFALFSAFVFCKAQMAVAASVEFKTMSQGPSYLYISISGEIVSGDARKLIELVAHPSERWLKIVVDSPGGSLSEAIAIAKVVKAASSEVSVATSGQCASACFLIWLAGSGRIAGSTEQLNAAKLTGNKYPMKYETLHMKGLVGLHRPYLNRIDELENDQAALMRALSSYLEVELVPRRLIDKMMSIPSNQIYWLTDYDLAELGEYPASQEELLIQKCGYNRNSFKMALEASRRGKQVEAEKIVDAANLAVACAAKIFYEAKRKNIEKFRTGWVPK